MLQGLATRYENIAIGGLSATEIGLLKKMLKSVYTNLETADRAAGQLVARKPAPLKKFRSTETHRPGQSISLNSFSALPRTILLRFSSVIDTASIQFAASPTASNG